MLMNTNNTVWPVRLERKMEETFSQRMGIVPPSVGLQVDSMDDGLRSNLWTLLDYFLLRRVAKSAFTVDASSLLTTAGDLRRAFRDVSQAVALARRTVLQIWRDFHNWPLGALPLDMQTATFSNAQIHRVPASEWTEVLDKIREAFFSAPWYHPYDLVQFVASHYPYDAEFATFTAECNRILANARSAYRLVDGLLVQMTSPEEISAIEMALDTTRESQSLKPVHYHLKRAVVLLADRHSPDYPNSMKESISAVEALCKWIANDSNATLGAALTAIERNKVVQLHPSLREAFTKLYGYTSDAGGIRHAMKDETDLDIEDAVFMLASCSAFLSYLTAKALKAGLLAAIANE
jgi:hypothetical protein